MYIKRKFAHIRFKRKWVDLGSTLALYVQINIDMLIYWTNTQIIKRMETFGVSEPSLCIVGMYSMTFKNKTFFNIRK